MRVSALNKPKSKNKAGGAVKAVKILGMIVVGIGILVFIGDYIFLRMRVGWLEESEEILMEEWSFTRELDENLPLYESLTVRIFDEHSDGSGFILDRAGHIVTNAHAVTKTLKPKVAYTQGDFSVADVVYHDEEIDVAILKTDLKYPFPALEITFSEVALVGDDVAFIGYPLGISLPGSPTVSKGYVSAMREYENTLLYQINASVNPGNSGGPAFNKRGDFIGIVTAGVGYKTGLGIVIPNNYIRSAYAQAQTSPLELDESYTEQVDLKTPEGVVRALYFYQKVRQLKKAYDLISNNLLEGMGFEEWEKGYANTLNVYPISFEDKGEGVIHVKLWSIDLIEQEFVTQYFEGDWEVREENGKLLLYNADILPVKEPSYEWFY